MNQCVIILKRMDNGSKTSVPQKISNYTFTGAYDKWSSEISIDFKICILY